MKRLLLAIAALMAAASFAAGPAQAQVGHAPWCAVVNMGTGSVYWDCQYRTVWDCIPNVLAGNRGTCNPNPGWAYAPEPVRHRHRRHHRAR